MELPGRCPKALIDTFRKWVAEAPTDAHRTLGFVADVFRRAHAEVGNRAAVTNLLLATKDEDLRPLFGVRLVAASGRRVGSGSALGLPMQFVGSDHVVVIACRR